MKSEWQHWAALATVALTASIMALRLFRSRKTGARNGCGCTTGIPGKR